MQHTALSSLVHAVQLLSGASRGGEGNVFFRAREIDPESVHSQPEDRLSSLIIPSTETEADFEWLHWSVSIVSPSSE